MNDNQTFVQQMAKLTAEADAFLKAGFRSLELASPAYREGLVALRNIPSKGCESLTLDERLACEAFVKAHIRQHLSQQPAPPRCDAAGVLPGCAPVAIPASHRSAGQRSRRSASTAQRFI